MFIQSAVTSNEISLCLWHVCSCVDSPDYVLVRDGVDELSSPIIARYCGHLPTADVIVTSSSNRAMVEFVSDGRNERQGFAGLFTFTGDDDHDDDDDAAAGVGVSVISDVTTHPTTPAADRQADHRRLQSKDVAGILLILHCGVVVYR